MRNIILGLAATSLVCVGAGPSATTFRTVSLSQAEREVGAASQHNTSAAMWIWADKYVYQQGEQLTLQWTIKPNNDFYPYTIVAYRQNNQTGAKSFLPGNNATPSDMFGNSMEAGFRITRLPEETKGVLAGPGGSASTSALTIPSELGMHTLVVQLRDYTGTRVVKSAYFKIGVVSATEDLPNSINENRTLTNDKAYRVRGIVTVRNNAVLTIQPGTFLIGQPGSQPPSVLLVSNQGRINAAGTRSRPIIMTSSQPFGQRQRGDWGGLILLGKAPINDPGGELSIEGLPDLPETKYGGTDTAHNCGVLRYVRVEFAGALLRPNEETNSFTWGACGSATITEHVQAHYGLDDSFEWFGGSNDAKYLVGTYGADDYIDVQIGYTGRIQHVLVIANDDLSNRGVEADNYERDFGARPLSKPLMWNMTFIGGGNRGFDETDSPCLYFRRGAGASINNVICNNWITRGFGGANFDVIQPNVANGDFAASGILLWDNGKAADRANSLDAQISADFLPFAQGQGRNFLIADPMLRRPLERNDPDPRPLSASPALGPTFVQPPDDGFFDQWAMWAGAFGDVNWTEEWTTFLQEQDIRP